MILLPLPSADNEPRYQQVTGFLLKVTMLICILLLPSSLYAKPTTEEQARQLASDFFNRKAARPVQVRKIATAFECHPVINRTKPGTDADDPSYYVFTPESGNGFVIISGNDEMKPIIGYSMTNAFDVTNMPVQLTAYLETYENDVARMQQNYAVQGRTAGGKAIAPLLTTQWNQNEPYNLLCGKYGEEHYPTGCVATAVAQVMKYFKFPAKGNGITEDYAANIDLSQSVYDWDNMKNTYNSMGTYSDAEANAVALLMRDVGYALWTHYGAGASSAYSSYVAPVMYKHFNYSKDIQLLRRECYTSQNWIDIIRENLSAGQPVLYSGSGYSGHTFVCDGIDDNDYLHINWGWGGYCDGYFDINALSPTGTGLGGGEGCFYGDHDMVVNIHPGDPDADNSAYEAPLLVWNFKLGDADYTDYYYHAPQLDADGRLGGKTPLKFRLYYNLLNNTRSGTVYDEYIWYGSLYDENKQLIKRFEENGTMIRGRMDRDVYREVCCLFDFTDIAEGNYYVSTWYKRDKDRSHNYEDKEFDFACDPFFPVTVKDGGLYFEPQTTEEPVEIISLEQQTFYEKAETGYIKLTIHNRGKEQIKNTELNICCIPEDEAVDNPDVSTLEKIGSVYMGAIYEDATVTLEGYIKKGMSAGRYRLYFWYTKDYKQFLVQGDEKYFLDVTPLPNDVPFVFTRPLEIESPSYDNTDHEWMKITTYYMPTEYCKEYWYCKNDVQFWAAPTSNPEDKFLLYESLDEYNLSYSNYNTSTNFYGSPDLLWKTPGEYRVWLRTRMVGENDWIEFDDLNNTGTFIVTDYQSPGQTLYMTAPMDFENGNRIKPGTTFNVTMKVKSPTGISMLLDHSFTRVTESTASYNNAAYIQSIEADKTELAPGEETEMRLKFYLTDKEEIYGKQFMVMVYVFYDEYYGEYVVPGEYMESIYFTADPQSGINDAKDNEKFSYKIKDNTLTIYDICAGETIELWSATGMLLNRNQVNDSMHEIALDDLVAGVYVVKVRSKNKTYQSIKIAIR